MAGWTSSCPLKKPVQTLPPKTEQKELCELYGGEQVAPQRVKQKRQTLQLKYLLLGSPGLPHPLNCGLLLPTG